MDNGKGRFDDSVVVTQSACDHDNKGTGGDARRPPGKDDMPQPLPLPQDLDPKGGEATGENSLDPNPVPACGINSRTKPKFNNKGQHRHWIFTFNNCTKEDHVQMKSAFEKDQLLPLEH